MLLSSILTLAASSCVRQHSQPARSDSWLTAERVDPPAQCANVDAEHGTRVLDLAASSGHLAPQKIRDVMQRHQASLSDCFSASLHRQPAFEGKVTLLFAIEPDGSVSQTSVAQSDLAECDVTQCLRAQLARLTFPAPEGGAVMVQYPISVLSQPLAVPVTASRR